MLVLRICVLKYIGANVNDACHLPQKALENEIHTLYAYIFRKGERAERRNVNTWARE